MGALSSVITPVLQIGSALGTVAGIVQPYQAVSQKNREADLKLQQLQQSVAQQKKQNLLTLEQNDAERRAKLRSLLSQQRASFGGRGLDTTSGSSEAVIQGMLDDSDQERAASESKVLAANKELDQQVSQQKRLNLLQKEQLRQKTILSSISNLF